MTKYGFGLYRSPVKETDYLIDTLLGLRDEGQEISYHNEMSPIESQGKKGACVGHAYEATKEWQEYKETGKHLQLSRQWIYELARKKSNHAVGTTMLAGAEILRELGVPLETYWPYTEDRFNIGEPKEGAYKNALIYKVNNSVYLRIRSGTLLRQVLLKFGPVAIGMNVYKNWYRHKNGHIPTSTICERAQGVLGGHAICLVGHSPKNKEYEFKNSWGSWGDSGYGYLTETEMKRSFLDGFALLDIPNKEHRYLMKVADLTEKEQKRLCV